MSYSRASITALALLGTVLGWSGIPLTQTALGANFQRGDVDDSGTLELTDGVGVFEHLFIGARALPCDDAADVDDDGRINISDGIGLLNFLFLGGVPPAAPFPGCGADPTEDSLDCRVFATCGSDGILELSLDTSGGFAGSGSTDFSLRGNTLAQTFPFGNQRNCQSHLSSDQQARLALAAADVAWEALERSYIDPENPNCCCDQIVSSLSVRLGQGEEVGVLVETTWCSATFASLPVELQTFVKTLSEVGVEAALTCDGDIEGIELVLDSSGGFAGQGSTDYVLAQGELSVTTPFGEPAECRAVLTDEQLRELLDLALAVEWDSVMPSFRPADNPNCCCDLFSHTLEVGLAHSDGGRTPVRTNWCDVLRPLPESLQAFISRLQTLGEAVRATCQ